MYKNERTIENEDYTYPSILNELEIEDEYGNKLFFKDFNIDEKNKIFNDWKQSYLKEIESKLTNDVDLRESVTLENLAFENTLNSDKGHRAINNNDWYNFYNLYQSNIKKLIKDSKSERAALADISNASIVDKSLKIVKENYKQGRFFVCKDSSSSSSSSYIGHSSIMHEKEWNDSWKNDPMSKITITSTPKENSADWKGKSDGVQYEPLLYWVGNKDGCAEKVSIYEVQKVTWIWCILFNYYKYSEPSNSDVDSAIKNANNARTSKLPYNWSFIKWVTSAMYCSQLVWYSWYNVSWKYELSQGPHVIFVTPSDLTLSNSAKHIVSYKNARD